MNQHFQEMFNLDAAREARDEGISRVIDNGGDWTTRARSLAAALLHEGWEGTGEDIRRALTQAGIEQPHSPNSWGAMTNSLAKKGMIAATGKVRPMQAVKSHGRETKVWRRI